MARFTPVSRHGWRTQAAWTNRTMVITMASYGLQMPPRVAHASRLDQQLTINQLACTSAQFLQASTA